MSCQLLPNRFHKNLIRKPLRILYHLSSITFPIPFTANFHHRLIVNRPIQIIREIIHVLELAIRLPHVTQHLLNQIFRPLRISAESIVITSIS